MIDIGQCLLESRISKGTALYSPIFGKVTFTMVKPNPETAGMGDIRCLDSLNIERIFSSFGNYRYHGSFYTPEVMLYPNERERNWERWLESVIGRKEEKHPYDRMQLANAEMLGEQDIRILKPFSSYRTYNVTELQGFSVHELVNGKKSSCGYHLEPCDDMVRYMVGTTQDQDLIDFIDKCSHNKPKYYMLRKDRKNCGIVAILYKGEQIENDYYSHSI